jgi:hypothetical protein
MVRATSSFSPLEDDANNSVDQLYNRAFSFEQRHRGWDGNSTLRERLVDLATTQRYLKGWDEYLYETALLVSLWGDSCGYSHAATLG